MKPVATESVERYPCPYCGARRGNACRTRSSRELRGPHLKRLERELERRKRNEEWPYPCPECQRHDGIRLDGRGSWLCVHCGAFGEA